MSTTLSQLSDTLAGVVESVAPATVLIQGRPRFPSSGVIWSPGVVVTADHTIQFDDPKVRLHDGAEIKATLAGRDRATDLAVLRIENSAAPPVTGDPATLKPGHIALAIGKMDHGVSAALGIISTAGGPWRTWRGGLIDRFLRLDISLYPNSSGAALAGANGTVFGIATAGLSRTSAIGIPRTTIDHVVGELLDKGHVARGYLGVGLQPVALPEHLKNKLRQDGGVIVLSVEPGGPAGAAGLFIGDVILGLNGQPMTDTDDMQSALAGQPLGAVVHLNVLRGGELAEVNVTVGERPRKE